MKQKIKLDKCPDTILISNNANHLFPRPHDTCPCVQLQAKQKPKLHSKSSFYYSPSAKQMSYLVRKCSQPLQYFCKNTIAAIDSIRSVQKYPILVLGIRIGIAVFTKVLRCKTTQVAVLLSDPPQDLNTSISGGSWAPPRSTAPQAAKSWYMKDGVMVVYLRTYSGLYASMVYLAHCP